MISLKEQVLQMVSSIKDEQLLELVKADIEYFNNSSTDILNDLNEADKQELLTMLNEPDTTDVLNGTEFKEATARWRTK